MFFSGGEIRVCCIKVYVISMCNYLLVIKVNYFFKNVFFLCFQFMIVEIEKGFICGKFLNDFIWGVVIVVYQIEGVWNEDGKGFSVWDMFCYVGGKIYNNDMGDVVCDSYYKIEEDVFFLKDFGVGYY